MTRRWLALALAGSVLSSCASYSAAPLRAPSDVLAAPNPAILSADASKIDRPYLTPQAIDLTQPLTPNALAVIAVLNNPDLKAQRTKAGVTDAQVFAARLLPDPSFSAGYDKVINPGALVAQLGLDLSWLRTRGAVRASGEAAKRQVRLDLAWAEWQTAGQARLIGVRVLALTEQLSIARDAATVTERLFAAAQRAAGRGDIAAADLDTRRQALVDATSKARTAESDLTTARGELNKTLGLPPEVEVKLAPPADSAIPPDSATLLAQALDRRLDLQALRAGYGVAEADLHKAVLEQFPNLSLTLTGARPSAGVYTVGPQIGFNLPLWNRNRGNIAIAKATREQLKAEYDARLFQTRAEIDTAIKSLMALRRQRAELGGQLPALQKYADATERAARRGDLSLATADTASQAIRDRRLALLQIDQQIAEQTIALELLSGGPSEGWTR